MASLYRYLHEFAYTDDRAIGVRVTLLHIWAWQHITVFCLRGVLVDMDPDDLVVW